MNFRYLFVICNDENDKNDQDSDNFDDDGDDSSSSTKLSESWSFLPFSSLSEMFEIGIFVCQFYYDKI